MDRHWLLTWTTYGTWLPGDHRGFVSAVRQESGHREIHNQPGASYDEGNTALRHFAREALKAAPAYLSSEQAQTLLDQFQETAKYRAWLLLSVAIMANHIHLVLGVNGDPDPAKLLKDFKSYGSRALNQRWNKPDSDTWWTEGGSKRKLPDETAVLAAVRYVKEQSHPLLVWRAPGC
jgi:REP element-mobilizing transposase RayT